MLIRQHLQTMGQCQPGLQKSGELAKELVAVMWPPAISLRASGHCQRMQLVTHQSGENRTAVCRPERPASGLSFDGKRSPAPELISNHWAFPSRAATLLAWSAPVLPQYSRVQTGKAFLPVGHWLLSLRFLPRWRWPAAGHYRS